MIFYQFILGLALMSPEFSTLWTMKKNKGKAVHKSTALVLRQPSRRSGLFSSRALSSGRINMKNIIKLILQVFINGINSLQEDKNGNFNCRYREKIIVVDHLFIRIA